MENAIHFAGISGSLRKGSFNTKLLNNVTSLLPENVTFDILSIVDLPLYNADLDRPASSKRPATVQLFRDRLARAQGLVVVSPEYNYSIPGGLKNAIDWASRGEDSPLLNKAIAVMGATTGLWGTTRMQLAFHAIFQYLNMKPAYKPEILVAQATNKFDDKGALIDEQAKDLIRQKLQALKEIVLQEMSMHVN